MIHIENLKLDSLNYIDEIKRQEYIIREQHGKLKMLDGILRMEIPEFKLEWVDIVERN
jgi:hypothetical protein